VNRELAGGPGAGWLYTAAVNSYLHRLVDYNNWANRELLAFLATLPPDVLDARAPGVYGSIRETMVHLLTSEQGYYHHLRKLPRQTVDSPGPPALDDLVAMAERSAANLEALADSLPPAGEFIPLWDGHRAAATIFTQLLMHGCEHRTQVNTILGSLGIEPPDRDSWTHGILVHGDDWPDDWGPPPR